MTPQVSVIIPAYNVAGYIGEAVGSVLAQSFGDFEVIVVNDGSSDRAALEAALASCPDVRLRYLDKANGGPASARNAGIAASHGKWVAFLDGDDAWLPNYLTSQFGLLAREPTASAAFPDGFVFGDTPWAGKRLTELEGHVRGPLTLKAIVGGRSSLNYCCLAKREAVERIGGFDESEAIKGAEDYDIYVRLLLAGQRIVANPEPLYRYRRHGDSLSADPLRMVRSVVGVLGKLDSQFGRYPELQQLARQRRNCLCASLEFMLGHEALCAGRWQAARDHWRTHQRFRPSWKVAAALGVSRISPRLVLACVKLRRRLRLQSADATSL